MSTILVIAAHPDDEIYGCGATIHRLVTEGHEAHALIITEGCSAQYPGNEEIARQKAAESERAAAIIGYSSSSNAQLPDMRLDSIDHVELNAIIEEAVARIKPTIVFTHHSGDINRDHQLCCSSTMVACRPGSGVSEIRHYETPSSTELGSNFEPNLFCIIDEPSLEAKLKAVETYASELRPSPHPRSVEKLRAWASYRGCAVSAHWAEAFCISKKVV